MDLLTDQAFFRSFHILFGIAWIGLLYYFNFVQTEYVKVADSDDIDRFVFARYHQSDMKKEPPAADIQIPSIQRCKMSVNFFH